MYKQKASVNGSSRFSEWKDNKKEKASNDR